MRASGLLDCRVTPLSWRVPHNRPARSTAKLLRRARRGLQQIPHFLLPESRVESSCVTGGLVAGGYQQYTAILHPLDLAVQDSKFRWITLVVRRVDGKQRGLDALQPWRRVVVARRFPLIKHIIGVGTEGGAKPLVEEFVGLLACRRCLVQSLIAAVGSKAVEHRGELRAAKRPGVVAVLPLGVVADGIDDEAPKHPSPAR